MTDAGFNMGTKTGFYLGYDNSNDGSYRSLPAISGSANVYQNLSALPHPQWVQQNGPFSIYMQNRLAPQIGEWNTYGMNAAVYTSDQSYWGFGDVPEGNQYSTIRAILAANTKCVMAIWTTMAINVFHQAGIGEPMGLVCKQIMDHNTTNQKIEKPSSPYDTPAFWNRTQFEIYGDPSVRLMQVIPPKNFQVVNPLLFSPSAVVFLNWQASTDNDIVGYHVYRSPNELGPYTRLTSSPINSLSYSDPSGQLNDWYMLRAIKRQQTGSGIFFNPSQGLFVQYTGVAAVKLSDFTATKEKQTAKLKWTTATESNTDGFMIQRSRDGISWKDLGFEKTKAQNGNSSTMLNYDFIDAAPLRGNNYYRLKEISQGSSFLSEIRKLYFDEGKDFITGPNPVHDELRIINASNQIMISAELYDAAGKLIFRSGKTDKIDMRNTTPGIYTLKITTASAENFTYKVVKE